MKNFCTLDLHAFTDKKANFHTHTARCHHAVGEDKEYVEKAIEAGYEVLGFSDHTPYIFDGDYVSSIRMTMKELEGYVDSILNLKAEYQKDIQIFLGFETEYLPKHFEETIEQIRQYPVDYMLLGQHYFDDEIHHIHVGRPRDDEEFLKTYVERVLTALDTGYFLYVAHPDIMNYVGDSKIYDLHMSKIVQELKKRKMPIEVNLNGYREGIHYPNQRFVELGVKNGNDFIIGVDAHAPGELMDIMTFQDCVDFIQKQGGKIINL